MKVREIMTRNPSSAEMESTMEEIATMMKEQDVGAIPILDEDQELAGIVTDRDIVVRCIAEGHDASECKAEDIIRIHVQLNGGQVQTAYPEMDVTEAARIMAKHQIRRLPVVENVRLVGMLSLGDVAVNRGNEEISGETLGEISETAPKKGGRQLRRKVRPAPRKKAS